MEHFHDTMRHNNFFKNYFLQQTIDNKTNLPNGHDDGKIFSENAFDVSCFVKLLFLKFVWTLILYKFIDVLRERKSM